MKKSLMEWIQVDAPGPETEEGPAQPHSGLVIDNMMAEWAGMPYAQLSVLLVHLRFLALVHQTHHWIAKGDAFYGDHQLFNRLYDKVVEEIDSVAERAVGMGGEQNVRLDLQVAQLYKLVRSSEASQTVPQNSGLARQSLVAECNFQKIIKAMCLSMKEDRSETPGIENLLQGIADTHESHIYLLKRRCTDGALGM
jgi:DNA-binding ferritin-like protein